MEMTKERKEAMGELMKTIVEAKEACDETNRLYHSLAVSLREYTLDPRFKDNDLRVEFLNRLGDAFEGSVVKIDALDVKRLYPVTIVHRNFIAATQLMGDIDTVKDFAQSLFKRDDVVLPQLLGIIDNLEPRLKIHRGFHMVIHSQADLAGLRRKA